MRETRRKILIVATGFAACLALAACPAAASDRQIGWSDLVPVVEPYEDPFRELSYDQIIDLRIVLLGETTGSALNKEMLAKVDDARARLETAGLDIEDLARQRVIVRERRTEAATSTNADTVGTTIRMPGYLLPLRVADHKVTEFLLVSTVGACIHTPPPPPNQVI